MFNFILLVNLECVEFLYFDKTISRSGIDFCFHDIISWTSLVFEFDNFVLTLKQ